MFIFKKLLQLGCLWLLSSSVVLAQDNIRFKRFSLEQGLSQEAVFAILQDSKGFMWFATQEGLNRFDGYQFKVYQHDPEDSQSLSHDAIYTLIEDSQGYLWLGTDGGGLDRFDPVTETFKHYRSSSHGLSSDRINVVFEDQGGMLWIGTDGGGLNRLNPQTGQVQVYRHNAQNPQSLNHNNVRSIVQDNNEKLWIGTDGGLTGLMPNSNKFESYAPSIALLDKLNQGVRTLHFDSHQRLWVGTSQSGLLLVHTDTQVIEFEHQNDNPASLCHSRVRDVIEDNKGKMWIATDEGLCLWQGGSRFINFKHDPTDLYSIGDNRTLSLYQDKGGVLWLGSFGGLNKWTPSGFDHFKHQPQQKNTLSSNIITAFAQGRNGDIWVGSYDGLNRFDPISREFEQLKQGISDQRIMSVAATSDGMLWIGTRSNGLDRYNPTTGEIVNYRHNPDDPNSLSGNGVTDIFEDRQGQLWVGVYDGGLNQFDAQTQQFTRYRHQTDKDNSLSSDRILTLYQTQDGLLWAGTEGGGLNSFDSRTGQFKRYLHSQSKANSLGNNVAWSIFEDKAGDLWVGTWGGGLNRWRAIDRLAGVVKFEYYGKKQGLPGNVIYDIVGDLQGNMWLSSNQGLVRFNPKNGDIKRYDVSDGLQDNEFNLKAALASSNGQLFFGGSNGFNAFFPAQLNDNTNKPSVVLTKIQKINKKTGTVDIDIAPVSIEFGYQDYAVSFEFAGLDFTAPQRNRYMYKLEGFDQDWVDIGTKRNTTFTNLPPDDYVFRVRSANNDGLWNEQGMAVKVTVTPPPWGTWWAYTLYTLCIVAVVMGYLRAHNRKLQEKAQYSKHLEAQVVLRTTELTAANEQLEVAKAAAEAGSRAKGTFIATMSHELRTPMTSIIGFAESLLEDTVDHEQRRHRTAKIIRNAKHLLQLMNDVLDISKIEVGKLEVETIPVNVCSVLKEVEELISQQAHQKGLSFNIDYRYPLPQVIQSDPTRLKQVLLNLSNNAIKFTEHGSITIKAHAQGNTNKLYFAVTDTGIGIEPDKLDKVFEAFSQADCSTTRKYGGTGLGLSISRQLVQSMGGAMSAASDVNSGSVFSFSIDMGVPEPDKWLESDAQVDAMLAGHNQQEFDVPSLSGRVLLAEDWPDNQELICMYIERSGAQVVLVENGQQAVETALVEPFDLILMDVQMPQVDGVEATQILRATGFSKPIVALTANVSNAEVDHYLQSGFDSHLRKPIEREAFYQLLSTHLAASNAKQSTTNNEAPKQDEQYNALVVNFVERLPQIIDAIDDAAQQQAWGQLKALLHNLKGLGGSFGYDILSQLAEPIFDALSKGRTTQALQKLPELKLAAADIAAQ